MPKQGKSTGDDHHRHPGPLKKRGRGKPMAAAAAPMTGNNGSDGNDGTKDVAITTTVKQKASHPRPLVPSASSVLLELADKRPPTTATASASATTPAAASATNKMSHPPNVGGAPAPTDGTDDPHHSVVPRLMDIYDDLAQSSTPQVGSASLQHHAYYTNDPNANDAHGGGGRRGTSARPRRASAKRSRTGEEYHRSASGSSGGNGGRKKGKASSADQRWSKRFTWPDELHRDFVSAIFDVGLKHSSPSAIIEFMQPNPDVTSERVKSHLQKYRLNRKKSRGEFMGSYDAALAGYRKRRDDGEDDHHDDDVGGLSCGEAAALCTHASLAEAGRPHDPPSMMEVPRLPSPVPPVSSASQVSTDEAGGVGSLPLPLLTASEKDGPVGQAFGYLVGMHHALSRQLEDERRRAGGGEAGASQHHPPHQQHHEPRREGRHDAPAGYSPPQQAYHPHRQPPAAIVEQAARAASMQDGGVDPSMMEVAASIPHATFVPVPRQTYGQQGYAPQYAPAPQPRAYQNQYEHQPQEQQYQQAPAPAPYQNQQYQQAYNPPQEVRTMQPPPQRQGQGSYPHAPAAAPAPAMRPPAPPPSRHESRHEQSRQPPPSHHPAPPSAPAPTANPLAPAPGPSPSTATGTTGRNTLRAQEESAAMQQEMRGQLAFQTKMRQLKRIELSKYGAASAGTTAGEGDERAGGAEAPEEGNGDRGEERPGEGGREGNDGGPPQQGQQQQAPEHAQQQQQQQQQGQGGDGGEHGDILWNPGEDDQMLFDFLMEP